MMMVDDDHINNNGNASDLHPENFLHPSSEAACGLTVALFAELELAADRAIMLTD
jgi:hypothetical protein